MLRWSITFLVIAVVSAVFGFSVLAAGAAYIAKILFVAFVLLAIVSFAIDFVRRS